ncbi:MAG: TIGR04211 family SH3 domain-containing protein [Gammaproteobacteria bacterium]|nr:TIGR04211 family SH3 domain-containing protein [Gammaproteobacteria bacterium]
MARLYILVLCGLFASAPLMAQEASAQQENVRYVNDMIRIDVRAAANPQSKLIEVIPSGTRLVVLEEGGGDFVHVRLESGAEGWVLGRFLTEEPIARTRVDAAQAKLEGLQTERTRLYSELNKYKEERNTYKADLDKLQAEHEAQVKELTDLRTTSSSAVDISNQNRRLQADLEQETRQRADAEARAAGATTKLFMVGAICAAIGAAVGFFVGSAPARNEKKWRRMPI